MSGYQSFAEFYDGLMEDARYSDRCDYLLELLKSHLKIPDTVRNNRRTVQLIRAVSGIDPQTAAGKNPHPVFRLKAEPGRTAAEHHALEAALLIFQGKVMMAGGINLIVREFPFDAQIPEPKIGFQKAPDRFIQLADGQREASVVSVHVSGAGFSSRRKLPSSPLMKAPACGES